MAETVKLQLGEGTPERVAFELMQLIQFHMQQKQYAADDVLKLYARCLRIAKGYDFESE